MTLSIRLHPARDRAYVTERPGFAAWLVLRREERVFEAVRDLRGVWWELRDEQVYSPVPWRLQRELDRRAA